MGLVFSISSIFIKKSSLANKWMSFSYSNSALVKFFTMDINHDFNLTYKTISSKKINDTMLRFVLTVEILVHFIDKHF